MSFKSYLLEHAYVLSTISLKGAVTLLIHSISTRIYVSTISNPCPLTIDLQTSAFSELISLCSVLASTSQWTLSKPSFGPDLGIVGPLYLAVLPCRDPTVRRLAVDLLATLNRQEGAWESGLAAQIGRWIIRLEEQRAGGVVREAKDIPFAARVMIFEAEIREQESKVTLKPILGDGIDQSSSCATNARSFGGVKPELSLDWSRAWKYIDSFASGKVDASRATQPDGDANRSPVFTAMDDLQSTTRGPNGFLQKAEEDSLPSSSESENTAPDRQSKGQADFGEQQKRESLLKAIFHNLGEPNAVNM